MKFTLIKMYLLASITLSLIACVAPGGGKIPENPQEFIQYYPKPNAAYTVDKSVTEISKLWIAQAQKCLNGKVIQEHVGFKFSPDDNLDYRTLIYESNNGIDLAMKYKMSRQIVLGGNGPKDGFIMGLVATAHAIDKNKTEVKIYRHNAPGILGLTEDALKVWSTGKGDGCPDMTQW